MEGYFCPCSENISWFVQNLATLQWRYREALNMEQISAAHLVVPSHVSPSEHVLCHLQVSSCLARLSLACVRAETLPACLSMKQESLTSQTSLCTWFADGILVIQLLYKPNDIVLPFCELRCADRSLLVSARIYFFPRPITCFIKLSRTV